MKLLVTGGAGFIGSNFIRHMLAHHLGVSVVNLDQLTYAGRESTLLDLADDRRYQFIRGDVADRDTVEEIMSRGFDAVVHFAAESHVDRSIHRPDPFVQSNIVGTHCLIEAARRVNVRRFIQISSDEVYGSIPPGCSASPMDALEPSNPYAASKAAADMLVMAAIRTHRFPAIIARCTNNYGPWQHAEKFIPLSIIRALGRRPIPIYGDGRQVRDWIHVEDHCRALARILMAGFPGRIYAIAGGNSLSNLEVARRILALTGAPRSLISHVEDRPGHDRRYDLDDSATRRELDWHPRTPFDQGLARTVAWYRAHRSWWTAMTKWELETSSLRVGSA